MGNTPNLLPERDEGSYKVTLLLGKPNSVGERGRTLELHENCFSFPSLLC